MDNLDKAKLESYIEGLCGVNKYTPAGNAYIISAEISPDHIKSAFSSREENITLLPLENKTITCPFGRYLAESVETAKTPEDLKAIADTLAVISNGDVDMIDNNKIQLTIPDWDMHIDEDVRKYLELHPEVDADYKSDKNIIEISLK